MEKLALFGGKKLIADHGTLRIDWPIIAPGSFAAVKKAFMDRDFSGRGSARVIELEKLFEKRYPGRYATALNSGTAALHAALLSVGVQPADEVIVPALSFIATATSVIHSQAIPIFADIEPLTYNISPRDIVKKITPKTKAVIIVHFQGKPADMASIVRICKKHRLKLIEDVAQAPGATYKGIQAGMFGDASIFSLMSQKNLATCGEAGILLNKDIKGKNCAEMMRIYGEIIRPNEQRIYNSLTLGWNYTLNPIQAAMATVQLKNFYSLTRKIQAKGKYLNRLLKEFKWIITPDDEADEKSVFHFYRLGFKPEYFGFDHAGRFRQAIEDALNAEGLLVRKYQNVPLPLQPVFQNKSLKKFLAPCVYRKIPAYKLDEYPNTRDVIRSTLLLGGISSAPAYLLCPGTAERYAAGFRKIERNIEVLLEYAQKIKYQDPWESAPVISDSYRAKYMHIRPGRN